MLLPYVGVIYQLIPTIVSPYLPDLFLLENEPVKCRVADVRDSLVLVYLNKTTQFNGGIDFKIPLSSFNDAIDVRSLTRPKFPKDYVAGILSHQLATRRKCMLSMS